MSHSVNHSPNGAPATESAFSPSLYFVHAAYDFPGVASAMRVQYYEFAALDRMRVDLKEFMESQRSLFSESIYEDFFSCADYGRPDDSVGDDEWGVFGSAVPAFERGTPAEDLHPRDVFCGLQAVAVHRVMNGDFPQILAGLSLYRRIMEAALGTIEEYDLYSRIELLETAPFARFFLAWIAEVVAAPDERDRYQALVAEAFGPLQPVLRQMLQRAAAKGWPREPIELGKFLLIVDHFQTSVEDRWEI